MTEIDWYDRSDWQLCVQDGCPNLFTDSCQGPGICAKAIERERGIKIFVAIEGGDAQYVTSIAKKH